jgi:hypothetical protein
MLGAVVRCAIFIFAGIALLELIVRVLACLAEGLGMRAAARVFAMEPNTVLQWLVEAANQFKAFSRYCLCEVHVRQVQLDELYAVLCDGTEGTLSAAEAIKRRERSPYWVWTAMDPESQRLVIDVGTRTLAIAQCVVHQVVPMWTWLVCQPLCLWTDDINLTISTLRIPPSTSIR